MYFEIKFRKTEEKTSMHCHAGEKLRRLREGNSGPGSLPFGGLEFVACLPTMQHTPLGTVDEG